jgi:hypothetical protein
MLFFSKAQCSWRGGRAYIVCKPPLPAGVSAVRGPVFFHEKQDAKS